LTSITNKTHSWHCHTSVDGTGAHTTWTQRQIKDGVLGGQSIHTRLKGKWRTPCHWSSNQVCQKQCQLIPSNASELYIKIKDRFLITNGLCKRQRNVHNNAGVRKYSPPLTELCICHLPEQEFESILLPPQLQTVEGQPELILIDWERLIMVTKQWPH